MLSFMLSTSFIFLLILFRPARVIVFSNMKLVHEILVQTATNTIILKIEKYGKTIQNIVHHQLLPLLFLSQPHTHSFEVFSHTARKDQLNLI